MLATDPQRSGRSATSPGGTLIGVQYLRAVAAVAVLVFHAAGEAGLSFAVGRAGVDLFFVLSGFLMVAITDAGSSPVSFMRDRIRRIVPAYWFATTVVLAGALAGLFPRIHLELGHTLASYLFVPARSPSNGQNFPLLVPGWTLNFEMLFYLAFAATMPLRSQLRQVIVLAALFAAAVAYGAAARPQGAVAATYSDPMLLEFVLGMIVGLLWKSGRPLSGAFGVGTLALALSLFALAGMINSDPWRALLFGAPASLALVSVLALERRQAVSRYRSPLLVGDASYSIYLWHTLAISVAAKACEVVHLPQTAVLPIGIALGLAAGLAGYWLIERPIMQHFKTRRRSHGAPVPVGS